eukprot:5753997-Prymnesium_polylepis.1
MNTSRIGAADVARAAESRESIPKHSAAGLGAPKTSHATVAMMGASARSARSVSSKAVAPFGSPSRPAAAELASTPPSHADAGRTQPPTTTSVSCSMSKQRMPSASSPSFLAIDAAR